MTKYLYTNIMEDFLVLMLTLTVFSRQVNYQDHNFCMRDSFNWICTIVHNAPTHTDHSSIELSLLDDRPLP